MFFITTFFSIMCAWLQLERTNEELVLLGWEHMPSLVYYEAQSANVQQVINEKSTEVEQLRLQAAAADTSQAAAIVESVTQTLLRSISCAGASTQCSISCQ